MANNTLQSLDDIFDGKFLRIPDYQRGYAWDKHQLKDFWEDLETLEEGHIHYTGVLTLEQVTSEMKDEKIEFWKKDVGAYESEKAYYIVDGQQRITTSIICLKVLFELFEHKNVEWIDEDELSLLKAKYLFKQNKNKINRYFFGYTVDNPSYEFLKTKIFGEKSSSDTRKETLYTLNLEKANTFFRTKMGLLTIDELEILFKKLTKKFKYNLYEISDDMDVFVAFETMNNRGKKLSNLELLKNRLIYLSTKFEDEDKQVLRDDINECWKTIYEFLGKNKKSPLDDDRFLKNHWIMYHDYSRKKGNDYIVDLLEDRYTAKKVIKHELSLVTIKAYTLSLKESIEHWYYLFNPEDSNYADDIKFLLDKLNRLNYGAFAPLLMAIFSRDKNYDVDSVCDLLKLMEKYIFLVFRVSQTRANTGDSDFYIDARNYYVGALTIEDIIGVKDIENNEYSGINWWFANYFDFGKFKLYLKEKFEKRDGYYSWSGLNYFLFEYELSLKGKNFENKINWHEYLNRKSDYISIEHIMPQSSDKECWKDVFGKYSEIELKWICNSLGNLVPLSIPKNSKLQNNCFDVKKNDGYKSGSYAEQEINQEHQWTIEEIRERGLNLLKFMADNWGIQELEDKDEKLACLFLPE